MTDEVTPPVPPLAPEPVEPVASSVVSTPDFPLGVQYTMTLVYNHGNSIKVPVVSHLGLNPRLLPGIHARLRNQGQEALAVVLAPDHSSIISIACAEVATLLVVKTPLIMTPTTGSKPSKIRRRKKGPIK